MNDLLKNKKLFQILDSISKEDASNITNNVMISDSIVNVLYLDGDNSVLMMKGPEKQITESYFGDRIAILVMVDKKEYERVMSNN